MPVHYLGLAQQRLAPVYGLGPGAPVGVLKFGFFSTPYLCTGSCSLPSGKACRGTAEVKSKTQKMRRDFVMVSPRSSFASSPLGKLSSCVLARRVALPVAAPPAGC